MKRKPLHNIYSKDILRKKLESENFHRTTISFYKYVILEDPQALRNSLYRNWDDLISEGLKIMFRNAKLSIDPFSCDIDPS
ncbi:hypothetical protein EHQ53_10345 [Leptospira langatensis]|uniref:Uncharacterized protein n=1 Tax=Leptospira langatensis TaxID=2484983 RepID=A0ABY2MFN9_9LEPT|nr:hypothetical protein EHQ53_10345 [Leptospira langatensis]